MTRSVLASSYSGYGNAVIIDHGGGIATLYGHQSSIGVGVGTAVSIGQRIGAGTVRVLGSLENMSQFQQGEVLVADMTDPDWEPIMKRASAIVTNRGGRTCHAAIIARELGIPAVVGCGNATTSFATGDVVLVDGARGTVKKVR